MYKNSELECVPNYKYLGIYFTAFGTFSLAKNELYKKALKAFFKLRKDFLSLNPGIKTSINVFDHTIKPILLYGSEIWGIFNANNTKLKDTNNIQINDCYKNYKGETLHLKFCKYILGLNHRRMGHGFRFLLPPFLYYPPFLKFSYKSFLFQNFHNHSFFLHLTISVDVIHHE